LAAEPKIADALDALVSLHIAVAANSHLEAIETVLAGLAPMR
jgi:hypothetical protein